MRERLDYAGNVVDELAEEDVKQAVEELRDDGVEALAICLLNSFMNGSHEKRAREIAQEIAPEMFVCASSEVLPEIREFERTSTTVVNAYLGPKISSYLDELESEAKSGESVVAGRSRATCSSVTRGAD